MDARQERQYDVAPDGRFLINMELESAAAPITLLMNWTAATYDRRVRPWCQRLDPNEGIHIDSGYGYRAGR